MLTKELLENRLKEMKLDKQKLANKVDVTLMTMYNKFNNPDSFKIFDKEFKLQ